MRKSLAAGTLAAATAVGAGIVALAVVNAPSGPAAGGSSSVLSDLQSHLAAAAADASQLAAAGSTTPTPSPTVSESPSPTSIPTSPTPSPSPSPTSTSPSPTPTSPSPSPTSTGPAPKSCLPVPSLCGWPDATNTGVPPGMTLVVHTGSFNVNSPGQVIDGWDVTGGRINVNANNVTIRNSRITTGSPFAIHLASGVTGVRIIDDLIVGLAGCSVGVNGGEYTAQRVDVSGCEDGFQVGGATRILDSWIHDLRYTATSHNDGIQAFSGSNLIIDHNTIIPDPAHGNSAVFLQPIGGPIKVATISNNLLDGAGYTVKIEKSTGVVISANRLGRTYRWGWLSQNGSSAYPNPIHPTLSGNVYDDNGQPAT